MIPIRTHIQIRKPFLQSNIRLGGKAYEMNYDIGEWLPKRVHERMLPVAHILGLDLHALQHSPLSIIVNNVLSDKGAVRRSEAVLLQNAPHADDLVGAEGDVVWDAPHEGEAVGTLGALPRLAEGVDGPIRHASRGGHQRVGDQQVVFVE